MSARTDLADALRTALPRRFAVEKVADLPDTPSKAVVLVRQQGFEPAPNAGNLFASFIVTVLSHHVDIDKAEDALDQDLPDVLEQLELVLGLTWTDAKRVLVKEKYHGFDIICSRPITKPY